MASNNYDVAAQNAALAGTNQFTAVQGEEEDPFIWSKKPKSLSDILKATTLPVVVKLRNESTGGDNDKPVDLRQPFLLYRELKSRKLHACNLRPRPATRDVGQLVYKVVGPPITFPESFPGYFKLLDSSDQPLTGIAEVSRLMSKSFVSTGPCEGYLCIIQLADTVYQKATLSPGLYYSNSIFEGTITYISKRKTEKRKLLRSLACTDDKGKTVLFPMDTKGDFYIAEINEKFSRHVNKAPPMIKEGLRARIVYGQSPEQECDFTGLVELKHVTEEHTIIGCTMTSSPRLFEMAVTTDPLFTASLNSHANYMERELQKYLKFAKTECDSYMKSIKVKKGYDIDKTQGKDQ
ncbi:unnamed protein product [Candidula unifasciata]|uniref:CABIT domain-containing protein n=1 Tax=Candidula unifasciata TaxID=100452 RepID=A0A8S3YT98_9EUPU|nr:unnamed protein product [Candidula unifasciata]